MPIEVKLKKGEMVDKALRRLKKKIDFEDILGYLRRNRYYIKPSAKRRQKEKEQAFRDMLRRRYADM